MTGLFLNNDYNAGLTALARADTGAALTAATVTAQLFQEDGTAVGSAVTLTGDGAGNYAGVIESSQFSSTLVDGQYAYCKWVAAQGGYDAEWRVRLEVGYRPAGS